MPRPRTLQGALERAAQNRQAGLRFVDRHLREQWVSWRQIRARALSVAGGLLAEGFRPGTPVGLFYPTGERFFAAFFGALFAGGVPVPLYPPVRLGRLEEYLARTARMLRSVDSRWVLSDPNILRVVGEAVADAGCRATTVERLGSSPIEARPAREADLALIQFSSGTTVDPKPVALSQKAVLAQVCTLNDLWPDSPAIRHTGASWLPLYHDMGLIGCVFPALERPSELTLIPPELFIAKPALWLQAISRFGATISPAPNFAFALCLQKVGDEELRGVDLSRWRLALCGAEMVSPSVLRSFSERFSPWGFRSEALTPVYGLSEAALAVTFSPLEESFESATFSRTALSRGRVEENVDGIEIASVGVPLPGFSVEIRTDDGAPVGDKDVGHVWVSGSSLMEGYYGLPEATREVLSRGWLNTGDLGFLHGGRLFLTGRAKDVIVVRGQNHGPDEIEAAASGVAEVRSGCAAAVSRMPDGQGPEEVWLFVERRRGLNEDVDARIAERCRRRALASTGLEIDRVIVLAPGTLPRTSSGKIRRRETLRRYLCEELSAPSKVTPLFWVKTLARSWAARRRAADES